MYEPGKSDSPIIPKKSANKDTSISAEPMEGRGLTKGNKLQQNTCRTQSRENVYSALQLIHQSAKEDKKRRFTALLHHVYNVDILRTAYFNLKKDAAPRIDGETWENYGKNLEENLQSLSDRVRSGAYRAKPVRRRYIPKPDGRMRALGVTSIEDKIVQRAMAEVLNAVFEADFIGFSYGFRPGRSPHKALDALEGAIMTRKVIWVLDADIRDFFNSIRHEWLVKFVEHRIADKRIVRLIRKWLNAGVLEDGKVTYSEEGAVQGGSISPLLANIYLHYVYDLWVHQWRQKRARGEVIVVRFADDVIAGFQYESDAKQFLEELKERFRKFGLELHPEKTRLIEFGRFAAERRKRRGQGKPETFTFLGFTHICGQGRNGKFTVRRQTMTKRLHAKVKTVKAELRRRMHESIQETGKWLALVLTGHYRYYGVSGNYRAMSRFRYQVRRIWRRSLNRRSQKSGITWKRMETIIKHLLPQPRIYHPYPSLQKGVTTQGRSLVR